MARFGNLGASAREGNNTNQKLLELVVKTHTRGCSPSLQVSTPASRLFSRPGELWAPCQAHPQPGYTPVHPCRSGARGGSGRAEGCPGRGLQDVAPSARTGKAEAPAAHEGRGGGHRLRAERGGGGQAGAPQTCRAAQSHPALVVRANTVSPIRQGRGAAGRCPGRGEAPFLSVCLALERGGLRTGAGRG